MDWMKTLNITAIGIVAWLLVVEWNQFQDRSAAQQSTPARGSVYSRYGRITRGPD